MSANECVGKDMPPVLLELRNIEAAYGPVTAVRGISMEVRAGTIATLLGANGAGKTTVLKTISGVLHPLKGSVTMAGKRIDGLSPEAVVRAGISHTPEGREIFPLLSIHENLILGGFTRRDKQINDDIEAAYGYFPELKGRMHELAGQLSGGQQQMLAIARSLMARPELLLLDEPSLGLSPRLTDEIFAIVARINKERGTTVLLVEQNARIALEYASYAYVMEVGRIVLEGTTEQLREHPDVKEFYLGIKADGVRNEKRWKRRKSW